jgi:hypothetical protein
VIGDQWSVKWRPEFRITDHYSPITFWRIGGKGIRTPDFQLAKLALYQLSYAPVIGTAECRLLIADFNPESFRGWFPD